jgi:aryl-alcohol dehydrogenase-like predicted oxidoreductase
VTAIPFGRYLLTTNFIERTASGQKYSGEMTPVPGRQRIQYVDENWAALDIVLSGEVKAEIRILWSKITGMPLPLSVMVG